MSVLIFDKGREIGRIEIRSEGLYRVLEARCAYRPGVQRLWLEGDSGWACLGVLVPVGDCLTLKKRLSRAAFEALPRPLRRAALQPETPPPPPPQPRPVEKGLQRVTLFGKTYVVYRAHGRFTKMP